jgi:CBS domain containing-hemolysin-like protein
MDDPGSSGQWLFLLVLLVLSGFFSALETAVLSIGRMRLKFLADTGDETARLVQRLKSDPSRFLGPVLVGNNVVNIVLSSLATAMAISLLGSHGLAVAVGGSALAILFFGEILPKSIAANNPEGAARRLAKPGYVAVRLLYPVSWAFTCIASLVLKIAGVETKGPAAMSQEELENVVEAAEEAGSLDADESQMIQGIFRFGDTCVSDVMVPRPDILSVPASMQVRAAVELVLKGHFSRIPVYSGSPENIAGFVHVKDLLRAYLQGPDAEVGSLLRPILFVPETKKVDELFDQMRLQRIHVAIALDEYGSTAGLVTMEDILEEIVGDILDEYDPAEESISSQPDGSFIIDGRVGLDEIKEELGLDLGGDEIDTIGGLVFHRVGRVPRVGDAVVDGAVVMRVEEMKGRRVAKVRVIAESTVLGDVQ